MKAKHSVFSDCQTTACGSIVRSAHTVHMQREPLTTHTRPCTVIVRRNCKLFRAYQGWDVCAWSARARSCNTLPRQGGKSSCKTVEIDCYVWQPHKRAISSIERYMMLAGCAASLIKIRLGGLVVTHCSSMVPSPASLIRAEVAAPAAPRVPRRIR